MKTTKTKNEEISSNDKTVLTLLKKSKKPLTAYDILGKSGIKAPQTVYRALEALAERGLIHRIQTLGAFVACHSDEEHHGNQFAVCRECKTVVELHDHRICNFISEIGANIKFHVEREILELVGLCEGCKNKD